MVYFFPYIAMHAVIDRQKNHGIHFGVLAKALSNAVGDLVHSVFSRFHGANCDDCSGICCSDRIFRMIRLQFGGGTLGHPWGNAPSAVANRVALEACVKARNEGRDLARGGNEIIREAPKWSPEQLLLVRGQKTLWKDGGFEIRYLFKKEFRTQGLLGVKVRNSSGWDSSGRTRTKGSDLTISESSNEARELKNTGICGFNAKIVMD
ncbi:hypothetical protein HAX54_014007 [Datura stramonium]|uniref:Ribulose bisphosphate carboxylase large subunit C-terminal domain-containing protein n=1 Tax=Datura stramonium TaxID=4076 RepID=A0ABS8Y5W0_DATST|nr:hypothetical protein [Datura stramonium]